MIIPAASRWSLAFVCTSLAFACSDESHGIKAVPDTVGPPAVPQATPCTVAPGTTTGASIRPLNHEGHGDGAVDVPAEYHFLTNPCPKSPEVAARGKQLFGEQCAKCHGPNGDAKDAVIPNLTPPAKKLTVGGFTEAYVFWRIREGGAFDPFNSAMPPFKEVLSTEDSWMVVSYVLSLAGADIVPLSPTMQPVTPATAGGLVASWRLRSTCNSLKLDRKVGSAAYADLTTLTGFVTEYEDTTATAAGTYCYRVWCEGGGKLSPPSNEECSTK